MCIFADALLWCTLKRNFYIGHKPPPSLSPAPGLQCQCAHDIHFWVLSWLESESNLANSPPVQIILKTDASKSGWGAYRNLVKYIVLAENVWCICNQEKTKADLLLWEALKVRKSVLLKRELHYCLLPSKKMKNLTSWYVTLDQKTKSRITLVLENRGIKPKSRNF